MSFTVFYLNPGANDDIRALVRDQMPHGWRLLTPSHPTEFTRELNECDFIVVADHELPIRYLDVAPRLKMIQHQGVGYEKIDLAACRARGIPVGLTPEGTSVGVAEHTMLLILALYKQLVAAANGVRANRWMQWELRSNSFELAGKSLGLVGFGRIGREVAKRALAFDARVSYYDPLVPLSADLAVRRVDNLEEFLGDADIVSLHVPLTKENQHFINDRTLGCMKRGSVLINTARGGLVDESALATALASGSLAGAALDVLNQEPPEPDYVLRTLPNVLVTPHISAGTRDALITKMRAVFANLLRFTRREPLLNLVPELSELALSAALAER